MIDRQSLSVAYSNKTDDYLTKLNLVSREEFDVQREVLLKTRLKIEELEKKLNN